MQEINKQCGNNSPKGPFFNKTNIKQKFVFSEIKIFIFGAETETFYLVPEGLKNAMNIAYFSTTKFSCPLNIFIIKIVWYGDKNINLLNLKMFVNI